MQKTLLSLILLTVTTAYGQVRLTQDPELERQLIASGLIHQPLPIDTKRSFEAYGWQKEFVEESPLTDTLHWTHEGVGTLSVNDGCVRLQFPTSTGQRAVGSPSDPDYATYGNSTATCHLDGVDWERYNRLVFSIYPDCEGARVVNLNLTFTNADVPAKEGYNQPSGSHLINLVNRQWNRCFLEIGEYQRDKVQSISFTAALNGRDRTTGDTMTYYIDSLRLQTVASPEKVSGWMPLPGRIVCSTMGYATGHTKQAFIGLTPDASPAGTFRLLDNNGDTIYKGNIRKETTTLGTFGIIDFTAFDQAGDYTLLVQDTRYKTQDTSVPIRISDRLWEDSQWRVLNFIFCQRCGYPVPGKHATCHTELFSHHDGRSIPFCGGWHDAGDLSQQTLQTGDVTFTLLEAYNSQKVLNPALAARLREEAEWGLEFILKNRYGDGFRASSMGLLIWQDGIIGTNDDIHSVRVQDKAFDNFLYAAYEAYAALTLTDDPMLQSYLRRVAEEDFAFALDKFQREGFDTFTQPYEHTYSTPRSLYNAAISWSASMLYKLTHNPRYAELAARHIRYTLDCQRTAPLADKDSTRGFFYRDLQRKSIVHHIHQSREQLYAQALTLLCQTQPDHPDCPKWETSIKLYADYLKGLMKYTYPYGMLPSGVYHKEEYKDTANFYALHLFPPVNAAELYTEQIHRGIPIDSQHYVRRFPVWFNIFNGNTAVHLSTGKAAAICANHLHDPELTEIAIEQLYWTVGKNPFCQSLIYGCGRNYPQMNSFSSGEMTGEMPVGIRTLGNDDIPYWPQTNNACYKEVWVTSAGKWLSLIAEINL